jgi:hypothetical protein
MEERTQKAHVKKKAGKKVERKKESKFSNAKKSSNPKVRKLAFFFFLSRVLDLNLVSFRPLLSKVLEEPGSQLEEIMILERRNFMFLK